MRQKYYKRKQIIAIADSVNNLMRQWNTIYQHAQYWQKTIHKDMMECVLNYTLTYARKWVKIRQHTSKTIFQNQPKQFMKVR
jgi:hypothetical protein